jgi:hypothetical protein
VGNIPQWLEEDSDKRKEKDTARLRGSGTDFFAKAMERVEVNLNYLGKAAAQDRLTNLTKPGEVEIRYRLDVRMNHGAPSLTYTDLFYAPGRLFIRCLPREGWARDFRFCRLDSGAIGVIADGEYVQMDADQFGDWIVKSAVDRLRNVA